MDIVLILKSQNNFFLKKIVPNQTRFFFLNGGSNKVDSTLGVPCSHGGDWFCVSLIGYKLSFTAITKVNNKASIYFLLCSSTL